MTEQNIFDDQTFFTEYQKLRDNRANYNNLIEQPAMKKLMSDTAGKSVLDKTTPRLIQFHIFKNAVNPPFLGGFSIFATVAA